MSSLPELPGAPYAVGMFPEFTNHQNTVALKIKGKTVSLTGGDYAIVDAINLVPYFKVSSKSFSMSGRKEFQDMQGKPLFELKSESMHLHPTYVAKRIGGAEEEMFKVKGKAWSMHHEMVATFTNAASGHTEELIIRGDWTGRNAEITLGKKGPVVATVSRSRWAAMTVYFDAQEYGVLVAPGVDLSLIAGLCMSLDDLNAKQKTGVLGAAVGAAGS